MGDFYEVERMGHEDEAQYLARKFYPEETEYNKERVLIRHNWVKCTVSQLTGLNEMLWRFEHRLTQRQIDYLYPYMSKCMTDNTSIEHYKMDLGEW